MDDKSVTVGLATAITMAWLHNPNHRVKADDVPAFLTLMRDKVQELAGGGGVQAVGGEPEPTEYVPAVTVRQSLADPNYLISMIDGSKHRSLKRHLKRVGITPAAYRERYGLKADYPMIAPSYSASRSAMAKSLGLGRKKGDTVARKGANPRSKPKGIVAAKAAAKAHLGGGG